MVNCIYLIQSYVEAHNIIKGMNSKFEVNVAKLWWNYESESLDEDFKSSKNDSDATEMSKYVEDNLCDVESYVKRK